MDAVFKHTFVSLKFSIVVDSESLCSDDVEAEHTVVEEKQEITVNIHERLLDEMKKSELHCNSETRNVQEKIDEISAEKSQQKEELNEMQHKAQVNEENFGRRRGEGGDGGTTTL